MRNAMVKKRLLEVPLIDDTIDEKQLISNRPTSCSAAKKQTKDVHLSRSLLPLFRHCSSSLSPDRGSGSALTDIANEHAQESDRAMVGPPAPSSLSRPTFCPQQLSHKKDFFRDFSSEICPWNLHDESLSCSRAPIKATHEAIETGGTVIHFEERCTAKNNFETNKFTFSIRLHNTVVCVEQSVYFSARLLRTVLVHANLSRRTHFLWNFLFVFFSCQRLKSMRALDEKHK